MKLSVKITLILSVLIAGIAACQSPSKKTEKASSPEDLAAGLALLKSNCYTCHTPQGGQSERIAPPMISIKRHYIDENTTKEEFTRVLIAYVQNPSEDKSKMPGARRKFGLMPAQSFSAKQLAQIAAYLYEAEIEKPDWFEKHYQEERGNQNRQSHKISKKEQAQQYAMATKAILGKNLMHAIKTKGTAGALEFCNTRAIPLTDSMAKAQGVSISRVSDKPRNPNNEANGHLAEQLELYKASLNAGETIEPCIVSIGSKAYYTIPIMTNGMCLQCHGTEQINAETRAKLNALYPTDKATGYDVDQLRGMWVVEGID